MMPTSKNIILIILVCLFALLASGGYFLCWPKYQEFDGRKTEIEIKNEEIRLREVYLSNLETSLEKLTAYSDQLFKIDSAVPTDPSIAALYVFSKKTLSENGLSLRENDLGELFSSESLTQEIPAQQSSEQGGLTQQSLKERIQEMPFSISVSGSYAAFKNFLFAIYRNSRLIEIKSISFSSPEEGTELFDFDLNLETQSYAY